MSDTPGEAASVRPPRRPSPHARGEMHVDGDERAPSAKPPGEPAAAATPSDTHRPLVAEALAGASGRHTWYWRNWPVGVLAVVVAALAALVVVLSTETATVSDPAAVPADLLPAVRSEVAQVLSYDYRTISKDLAGALADTTGAYRRNFDAVGRRLASQTARAERMTTQTTVVAAALTNPNVGSSAAVLVFLEQHVTAKAIGQRSTHSSALVTMRHVDGRWLINDLHLL